MDIIDVAEILIEIRDMYLQDVRIVKDYVGIMTGIIITLIVLSTALQIMLSRID